LAIAIAAACTGQSSAGALRVWRRDHANHDSPNAGHPEAAMAGALGVCLGGTNYYDGVPSVKALLGAEGPTPTRATARAACRIVGAASLVGFVAALAVALVWRS
jgi:adenosylcobinamide-phosphate synthase